jgi:enoyl-[acyl-carrier-protein] reductase (NADH)
MVNRKEDQGQEAIEKIKKELGDDAKIEWTPCDLGSLKNVKEVFTRIQEQEERLDLVIYPHTAYSAEQIAKHLLHWHSSFSLPASTQTNLASMPTT